MIRVMVVEDEAASRDLLVGYLEELAGVDLVGQACDGPEGLALTTRHKPDALFLDIEMPGLRGTDLARALPEPRPRLVFVTAHPEHAVDAFRLGAAHYLLKPVSRVDVAQALARLYPADPEAAKGWLRLPVRRRGTLRYLSPGEVQALKADLGDCLALTHEGWLRVEGTLLHWEERLTHHGFQRVHRQALVRLEAVRAITDAGEVELRDGTVPCSRRLRPELEATLGR